MKPNKPWSDPKSDPVQDLIDFKKQAEEQYIKIMAMGHPPGKTSISKEFERVQMEEPKKKLKPSDFVKEKDEETIHEAKLQILVGLQGKNKNVYRGSVDRETVRRRRARNKRARLARRKNRNK